MFFWPCSLLFLDRTFLSPVSSFCSSYWGFPWVFHGVFFSAPLLSFLPLGCSCWVGVLCVPCASLLYVLLFTLSFSVSNCSFFLLYWFPVLFLVLPLCLWFRSCSSPALSSSSVPCRWVLRVCLQFRLCLGKVILIHFPLLWLLPLRLLSGFHLLLPFSGTLLLLGRISLRSLCDDTVSLFTNFTCLIITPCWSFLLQLGVSTLQKEGGGARSSSPDSS